MTDLGNCATSSGKLAGRRLSVGEPVPYRSFDTVSGRTLDLGKVDLPVHIQFRRFAGCPVCSVHLLEFVRRRDEWRSAFHEIVLFHSNVAAVSHYAGTLPFDVVADPDRRLYRAFGVEASPRAVLDPRAWPSIAWALAAVALDVLGGRRPLPPVRPAEGSTGLPADFLVGPDARLLDLHYGRHAADHWSVDDVLRRVDAADLG